MTYFEYSIEIDKLDLQFDLFIGNLFNNEMYTESVGSFFNKLSNALINYINDCKGLHKLYKEKKNIDNSMKYINKLCKQNVIANQEIIIRGYNGKMIESLSIDDEIQSLKNIITYATVKQKDPLISNYFERYEVYKSGWDIFYKVKIKDIPSMYTDVSQKLDKSILDMKNVIKDLSSYFENAEAKSSNNNIKGIFKNIIDKIKTSIKRDINIITMNFEAIQYEIGKKFSKLTKETASKVIKNVSDSAIKENSTFIKDIKYGDTTYKIYKTIYKNVSAMNYGGSYIYVENGFFDLPKGYQLAILYHEIGHDQCKHFKPKDFKAHSVNKDISIEIEDTNQIVKHLKNDLSVFLSELSKSHFYDDEKYLNGEEFIYLLVEWEADRFASNIVGKRLMKKALNSNFSDILKSRPYYKDAKKQQLHYKYNMDRMRLRTKNI